MKFLVQGEPFLDEISGCDYYTAHREISPWLRDNVTAELRFGNHNLMIIEIADQQEATMFKMRWADQIQ